MNLDKAQNNFKFENCYWDLNDVYYSLMKQNESILIFYLYTDSILRIFEEEKSSFILSSFSWIIKINI